MFKICDCFFCWFVVLVVVWFESVDVGVVFVLFVFLEGFIVILVVFLVFVYVGKCFICGL